jgi:hypothetical protein
MSQTDIRSFNISRPLLPVTIQNEIIGHALPYSGTDYAYKPDLAQSVVVPSKRWYACFVPKPIPSEYTTGEQVFDAIRRGGASALERAFVEPSTINYSPTSNPGVLCVYDFVEDKWFTWTGLDALGGLAVHNDEIYGATRQLNSSSTLKSSLWKLSDYWPKDYTGAINFEYITAWEDLEDPSLLKVFPRMQLFSVKEGQTNSFTLTVTMDKDWAQSSTVSRTITLNGASAPNNEVVALTNQKVKAIRYRFSNSVGTEKPIISGWATEVATENKPNLTDD